MLDFEVAVSRLKILPDVIVITFLISLTILYFMLQNILRLEGVPGPTSYSLTKWRLAYDDWKGRRTRTIQQLHLKYGTAVRIGPNELSFNSLSAMKTIYGAGSCFERTSFYRMFDVYGHQNLFTFASVKAHSERKRLLSQAYSKSSILKFCSAAIEEKVWEFMRLLETEPEVGSEIFSSLHYYSLDNITHFLYGTEFGATSALTGSHSDRKMLDDVLDPSRRKLAWFATHLPRYTKWLMSRSGFAEKTVAALGMLPQQKPTVYTGIRRHALESWERFSASSADRQDALADATIIAHLGKHHILRKSGGLSDMEIASEAADHLLAGVDTTSDTLMFLI